MGQETKNDRRQNRLIFFVAKKIRIDHADEKSIYIPEVYNSIFFFSQKIDHPTQLFNEIFLYIMGKALKFNFQRPSWRYTTPKWSDF